jgi:hypothetical protein
MSKKNASVHSANFVNWPSVARRVHLYSILHDIQPTRDQKKNGIFGILLGNYRRKKLNFLLSAHNRLKEETECVAFCSRQTPRRNQVYGILLALETPATKVASGRRLAQLP